MVWLQVDSHTHTLNKSQVERQAHFTCVQAVHWPCTGAELFKESSGVSRRGKHTHPVR